MLVAAPGDGHKPDKEESTLCRLGKLGTQFSPEVAHGLTHSCPN